MRDYMIRKERAFLDANPHGNPSLDVKAELEAERDRLTGLPKLRPDQRRELKRIEKLLAETPWPEPVKLCDHCGGTGMEPGEPQPDSFGNYTPCDDCEGTGLLDFERDRPLAE